MAASKPSQVRTVDPFASFNSDTVNKLTKMVTFDEEGLARINDLRVTNANDARSTAVFVSTGFLYKDNVLFDITSQTKVDFNTADHYYDWDSPGLGFNENGYYYIVLNYNYVKSRPAPEATYQIIKPSQRGSYSYGGSWVFLACVLISGVGGSGAQIDAIYDYDPTNADNKRVYAKTYAGSETSLPTHDRTTDQSRIAYEWATDTFWFGYADRWSKAGASVEINIDTTGLNVGELCYSDSDGKAALAIATGVNTGAEIAVAAVGTEVDRSGRALMTGPVENARVETGIIIQRGEILYLSATEAGTVTNIKTNPAAQVVGRALTSGNSSVPIDMLFFPRDVLVSALTGTIQSGDWTGPDGDGLYNEVIDVSSLDVDTTTPVVLVNVFDALTNEKVSPANVIVSASGNSLVFYTSDNTVVWNYIISTGGAGTGSVGGGGGGGGVTEHDLLLNLDYASSGHTGFAAGAAAGGHGNADHSTAFATDPHGNAAHSTPFADNPHGNTQHSTPFADNPHGNAQHTSTYITASGVNYSNLLVNGSVGTGGTQVAQGNHTHAVYAGTGSEWTYTAIVDVSTGSTVYTLATGLPAGIIEIEVLFQGISNNTNFADIMIQLGHSGGYVTTNYTSNTGYDTGSGGGNVFISNGFRAISSLYASQFCWGVMRLARFEPSWHSWTYTCLTTRHGGGADFMFYGAGAVDITAELDRVRLTSPGGVALFDGGYARMRYKTA